MGFWHESGIEVELKGGSIKVKFGEVSSEPFAARIFWALGYHVEPTDYARQVKVRYDRRLFQDFHSRRELKARVTLLHFFTIHTIQLQARFDPFQFIAKAVLGDGREWSWPGIKGALVP